VCDLITGKELLPKKSRVSLLITLKDVMQMIKHTCITCQLVDLTVSPGSAENCMRSGDHAHEFIFWNNGAYKKLVPGAVRSNCRAFT